VANPAAWINVREIIMNTASEVFVTLPAELLRKLREQAKIQGIPFLWLVAGLVSETLDSGAGSSKSSSMNGLAAH
jgi:hypothetical protein